MSSPGVTSLGHRWEIRHSLWIGWTFTLGFFNWVGFVYAGIRAKKQSWVMWGTFYSVPFILAMIFAERSQVMMEAVVVPLTIIFGIAGIIHAFRIRPEYLRRLAARQPQPRTSSFYPVDSRRGATPSQDSNVPTLAESRTPAPAPPSSPSPTIAAPRRPPAGSALVDLNAASEEDLAMVPELGATLAKRAVEERASRGGFSSVDELGQALSLKPHIVERLRSRFITGERPPPRSEPGPAGRVVDY